MKNKLDFHKEIAYIKSNNEDQTTPYISISNSKSDSSNLQVESSHFTLNLIRIKIILHQLIINKFLQQIITIFFYLLQVDFYLYQNL